MKCRVVAASWNGHPKGKLVSVDAAMGASLIRLGVLETPKKPLFKKVKE